MGNLEQLSLRRPSNFRHRSVPINAVTESINIQYDRQIKMQVICLRACQQSTYVNVRYIHTNIKSESEEEEFGKTVSKENIYVNICIEHIYIEQPER